MIDVFRALLSYDADTGSLRWKHTVNRNSRAGDEAGSYSKGYRAVSVLGKRYQLHVLCWAIHTGEMPKHFIDHINGNPTDNRFINLREATPLQSSYNRRAPPTNTTGFKGVSPQKGGRYMANIQANGKRHYLGTFCTPIAAHEAYVKAAHRLHGEFART